MLKGFRDFIMRGNLVELATAFIMATAFAALITAFVGFVMSIISKIFGGPPNFDDYTPGDILVGPVITALIAFLIIAAAVYFMIIVPYDKFQERRKRGMEDEPEPIAEDVAILQEIRDLLAAQQGRTPGGTV